MKINNTALINEKLILFYIIISLFFYLTPRNHITFFFLFLQNFLSGKIIEVQTILDILIFKIKFLNNIIYNII